jgi:acetyl esterase/lipase
MRSLPSGPWEVLFQRALRLVDDIQRHGGLADPLWTFGGGTVLMFRYGHRLSKDIDIFAPNPQYLGYVTPRLVRAQGVAPREIVLAGDSAGGNLALALLHRLREFGEPMPACTVALSPFVDFTRSGPSLVLNERRDPMFTVAALVGLRRLYLAPQQMLLPTASPLFGRFEGWPPLPLQASDSELLRDDAVRLAEQARTEGVEVELQLWAGRPHVFQAMPFLPQSGHAIDRIALFVDRHQSPQPA